MRFFRRLFHRTKRSKASQLVQSARARENDLESAWTARWREASLGCLSLCSVSRTRPLVEESENLEGGSDSLLAKPAHRGSDFFFSESRMPAIVTNRASTEPKIFPAPAVPDRETVTSARPPWKQVPGALLSTPRFQECVQTFLETAVRSFPNAHDETSSSKSSMAEPATPIDGLVNEGCCHRRHSCNSLTVSLADSIAPSLDYSSVSRSNSTHSAGFSADAASTSPSQASGRSYFSSSTLSSFFSKRRMKLHYEATETGARSSSRRGRRRRSKHTGAQPSAVPPVRNPNTYAGSRSMSGPYPCISTHAHAPTSRMVPASLDGGDYYP